MESEVTVVKDKQNTTCSGTFDTNQSLKIHEFEHSGNHKDDYINEIFEDVSSVTHEELNQSIKQNDKPVYRCDICSKNYSSSHYLTVHMYKHTGMYPFRCNICGEGLVSNTHLKEHMTIKHLGDRPYVCSICGKTFTQKKNLQSHLRVHTDEKRYQCSICEKRFRHLNRYKSHQKLHDQKLEIRKKPQCHECNICGKRFSTKLAWREHSLTHTGERPHQCEECGKTYIYIESFKCHMRTHSNEKPYQCHLCDKKYRHPGQLKQHIKVHTGDRPHLCTVCGKGFIKGQHLKVHMYVHTGERPYKCSICDKGFTIKVKLEAHMRSHTKEKPYQCNLCPKGFASKRALTEHLSVHSMEQPYRCDICKKSFKLVASFRCHIKLHLNKPSLGKRKVMFGNNEATEEGISDAKHGLEHSKQAQNDNSSSEDEVNCNEFESQELNNKRPHMCLICQKHFTSNKSLKNHIVAHSKAWANQVTLDKILDRDMNIQVQETSENCYSCSVCKKDFALKENTLKHLLIHKYVGFKKLKRILKSNRRSTGKTFFSNRVTIERDLAKQCDKSLFKCIFCTRSFVDCETLKIHILTHLV